MLYPHLRDFRYELPPSLIAQTPLPERSGSRLLCLDSGLSDRHFINLPELLRAGDRLVFNDTRVIAARMFGVKPTGGQVEVLVERVLDTHTVRAQVRASKSLRVGMRIHLAQAVEAEVVGRTDEMVDLRLHDPRPALEVIDALGHIPLPPYITRDAGVDDATRYQTVYARTPGAVAAPTAGLHFDAALLARLAAQGVEHTFVTLHVGAGTFQPVRVDDLRQHQMHAERVMVNTDVCAAIAQTRARGGRVIAVGTTAVRALESAAQAGTLQPYTGETRLFITPGFHFRVVDAMITNFHLPESTLLMLVCAFAGYERTMAAYRHAVAEKYRFFSYGDALFVNPE